MVGIDMLRLQQLLDAMTQEQRDALEARRNDPMRRAFDIMLQQQRQIEENALQNAAVQPCELKSPPRKA